MFLNLTSRIFNKLVLNINSFAIFITKNNITYHIDKSSNLAISKCSWKSGCSVKIDKDSVVSGSLIFDRENASISIGKRVFMNGKLIAAQNINIGDDVMISWNVTVVDHDSHSVSFSKRADDVVKWQLGEKDWSHVNISPVTISDKVWIGFNSIILKGVTIGEGAVIGAGSVVTKDIPSWTICAGNPACLIREIPENER